MFTLKAFCLFNVNKWIYIAYFVSTVLYVRMWVENWKVVGLKKVWN